jgi:predicted ferric reductase
MASPRFSPRALRWGIRGGGLLVTALWAVQAMASLRTEDLFTAVAHLTGLLAGYGVVVMLLLIARVPAIEHGVGADRLARWHAWGGRYVLALCAAHALFALLGYAVAEEIDLTDATAELLRYPAGAAAVAGFGVLVVVGILSARRIRVRVSHETWRAAHTLMYVGAGLAFAHQLSGPDIAGSLLAAWVWSMLHTTVGVLLVWYRLVVPLRMALRHGLRVEEVRREAPDVVSVCVRGRDLAALRAEPGQFFRWRFLTRRLWRSALPFSLSAPVAAETSGSP